MGISWTWLRFHFALLLNGVYKPTDITGGYHRTLDLSKTSTAGCLKTDWLVVFQYLWICQAYLGWLVQMTFAYFWAGVKATYQMRTVHDGQKGWSTDQQHDQFTIKFNLQNSASCPQQKVTKTQLQSGIHRWFVTRFLVDQESIWIGFPVCFYLQPGWTYDSWPGGPCL